MSSSADWTLVTVTYNSAATLRRCWTAANIGDARWIVVDNASTDGSVDVARSLGADVVTRTRNDGFSVANNAGLAVVETPWVMFVNPDVTVGTPADLDRLAATAARHGSLVAPRLIHPDGTDQRNGRGLPLPTHKIRHRGVRLPWVDPDDYARADLDVPTYVAWAIGAAIGGPTTLLRSLRGWDERYFVYYEDHDLGLRSWASGHPVILDPVVSWVHEWQRETARLRWAPWRHELRSARRFYATYPGLRSARRAAHDGSLRNLSRHLWSEAG
ncbi:glycosyltransferase [Nocardioides sp. LHD-245]|uniref:glycosyltransferase n=1 Tax=Nocardioides sp. LHD-245 TaxID=3051387 RepID=UPI0027DFB7D8|nr:glycosyltransferase [Nocardioides sp. LHD-245]